MVHRSSFVQALQKQESGVATRVKPRNAFRPRHLLQLEGYIPGLGCARWAETNKWRLIAFLDSFENTEEILTAFKNVLRSKSHPIYIGNKLNVDGYVQNNPDKPRWPSTLRGWIPTEHGGGCTNRWTQKQGLVWCWGLCLLCWFDGCLTKTLEEVPSKRVPVVSRIVYIPSGSSPFQSET